MWLKPGHEAIYKEKHDQIWAEMLTLMKQRGIRNYSIYRHGLMLFAYLEHEGPRTHDEPPDPIMLRWWKMMEPYMVCNPDGSPPVPHEYPAAPRPVAAVIASADGYTDPADPLPAVARLEVQVGVHVEIEPAVDLQRNAR